MKTEDIIKNTDKFIAHTYGRYPIVLVKGIGCKVYDSDNKEYLDFVSGLAVNNLGHCHPNIVNAIKKQAEKLIHVSNLYHIPSQTELAGILVENSFADKAFFCNSGAEANEAAIKLARKYHKDKGNPNRFEIITMKDSFHGRTMATITATGQEKFHKGFEPLLPGFSYCEFNNILALKKLINKDTCAVMLEPIQGEGGVNMPDSSYLKDVEKVCKENDILLILDEVQVGMGRTGSLFAYENYNITPDILTLAKGLAGGVAIGTMLAIDKVAKSFVPGTHASTFGGNPLACSAGIAFLNTILDEGILIKCKESGVYFTRKLNELENRYNFIKEVRGEGLIIGMELTIKGADIVTDCMKKGLLINCAKDYVLRFLPPLTVNKNDIDKCLNILESVLNNYNK